ncbi:MAG: hypothetical protein JXR59_02775 [Desulfuromonadaceae bacterium]|nr:hypothetical protein [Desulfuromonadaceae bacterium]
MACRCGALEPQDDPDRMIDTIAWLYQDLAPKGAMQTLLASQIIATYLVLMRQLHKTTQEASLAANNMRVNMATKLMRALNLQLGLLATLQGVKMQSIKVEHLNVSGNSVIGIGGRVDQGRSSQ